MSESSRDVSERAMEGQPVALTQALVAIPSVNPVLEKGGAGEEAMARQCGLWLDAWGFETHVLEVAPGRHNVVAVHRGEDPGVGLILNGHLDTVGVDGMGIPPFGGGIADGRVWGRGACDMKGGLAIILATARNLSREGHPGTLTVALTADEEHASLGMQAFVKGAGGGEGAAGIRGAAGAVVCEPTSLAVMPAHKGFLWIDADFRGRAAHGSRPEEGVDAIYHAGLFLAALKELEGKLREGDRHLLLDYPSFHAGTIQGGSAPSVYPQECRLVLERRTLPGEDRVAIMAEFQEILDRVSAENPGMDGKLTPGLFRPGTEVAVESPLVQGLLRASEADGRRGRVEAMTAWVDAAFLNEVGIPAVCFGPGSIAQAHSEAEWVPVEELEAGARILTRFSREFMGQAEG